MGRGKIRAISKLLLAFASMFTMASAPHFADHPTSAEIPRFRLKSRKICTYVSVDPKIWIGFDENTNRDLSTQLGRKMLVRLHAVGFDPYKPENGVEILNEIGTHAAHQRCQMTEFSRLTVTYRSTSQTDVISVHMNMRGSRDPDQDGLFLLDLREKEKVRFYQKIYIFQNISELSEIVDQIAHGEVVGR